MIEFLLVGSAVLTALSIGMITIGPNGRRIIFFCWWNKHVPNQWRPAAGGREIQTCYHCNKLIRERHVMLDQAKKGRL